MGKLRFRQVHLDFHTSGFISDIGAEFNKKQFQEALKKGYVDSITVFSKCHHGWAYHPTKVHEMHPNLSFDLLKAQIEACEEIDVKCPVYISAGVDEKEAVRHPEWLSRFSNETTSWVPDFVNQAGFHLMCFNTGYLDLLLEQIKEVMENYHPKGIFLDIANVNPCYCSRCRQDILARGKDPRDMDAVIEQAELVYKHYGEVVEKTIHAYDPECTIFHNAGHITRGRRDLAHHNTHLELESLPTGGWGYDHFPMSASYVCNVDMEYLGMTGKFHSSWGEFGGFKHPNALRYETSLSLAFGAKCSIGDQLHPSGEMNKDTYELIGKAYKEVAEKEPWCVDAVNLADIGILGDEVINSYVSNRDTQRFADIGANRIMLEGKYLYRFVDLECNFNDFKLLVLPDTIKLDEALEKRLEEYLSQGGKILATGKSGLNKEGTAFVLDFGAKYLGENQYRPNYLIPDFAMTTGISAHVMYEQSYDIEVVSGTCLGKNKASYFNRDVYQFCSHQHTPEGTKEGMDAISITGQTAYIGWDIFTDYAKKGSLHVKECIMHVMDALLKEEKTLTTDFVDRGIVTLTKQHEHSRYVNHLLFAHTTIRGKLELFTDTNNVIEMIEGIVPVYNVAITLRVDGVVDNVYLVPNKENIPFTQLGNKVSYIVPKVDCHQMVVVDIK